MSASRDHAGARKMRLAASSNEMSSPSAAQISSSAPTAPIASKLRPPTALMTSKSRSSRAFLKATASGRDASTW